MLLIIGSFLVEKSENDDKECSVNKLLAAEIMNG